MVIFPLKNDGKALNVHAVDWWLVRKKKKNIKENYGRKSWIRCSSIFKFHGLSQSWNRITR